MPITVLKLQVEPGTDVLDRVVCVCRRRSVEILALNYAQAEIDLAVEGESYRLHRLRDWLGALVNVLEVRKEEPPPHEHETRPGLRARVSPL